MWGVNNCGKGQFLRTDEYGVKSCVYCPVNTYKNKINHIDSNCDPCGTYAFSLPGRESCTSILLPSFSLSARVFDKTPTGSPIDASVFMGGR